MEGYWYGSRRRRKSRWRKGVFSEIEEICSKGSTFLGILDHVVYPKWRGRWASCGNVQKKLDMSMNR